MSQMTSSLPGPWLLVLVALATLALSELAWRLGAAIDNRREKVRTKAAKLCARVVAIRFVVAIIALGAGIWAATLAALDPAAATPSWSMMLAAMLGLAGTGILVPRACATVEQLIDSLSASHHGAGEASSRAGGSITDRAA